MGGDGFWKRDYGWGVRVRRPFGARRRTRSSVPWTVRNSVTLKINNQHTPEVQKLKSLLYVCVECLIGKQRNQFSLGSLSRVPYRTELTESSRVRQKGGVPGPPTRNPSPRIHRRPSGLPTALQEQSIIPGSAPARNVFRYWGSPQACCHGYIPLDYITLLYVFSLRYGQSYCMRLFSR